jgi:hypothetical protein
MTKILLTRHGHVEGIKPELSKSAPGALWKSF